MRDKTTPVSRVRWRFAFSVLPAAALLAVAGGGCGYSADSRVDGTNDWPTTQGQALAYAKDSVIVRFRAAPTVPSVRALATRATGAIIDRNNDGIDDGLAHIAQGTLAVLRFAAPIDVGAALEDLRRNPTVLYAEPNYLLRIAALPDDARFSEQYALHNTGQTDGTPDADIDAPEAWDSTVGGSDVVVGVIDTGVDYRHEDLAANIWSNPREIPGNGIDDDGNGVIDDVHGFNAITGSGDPFDDNHHGTHVSGTIGAIGNNGVGVAGVNWDARIMAIKFLDNGGWGTTADAIRAIDYAVAQKHAGVNLRVLSNSWGGDGFSQSLLDAITAAGDADLLFVAAAGNSSGDNDAIPYYPAGYQAPNIVSVAATDHTDGLAWFSNFGATSVDLAAPGEHILSTVPNHGYEFLDGTSMATPHVAGVAALALSVNASLTVDELKQLLLTSGDPVPALAGATVTGRRVNAASAVAQAGPATPRFTMSVAPPRRVVAQEQTATYHLDVRSILGFAGDVALSVSSQPPLDAAIEITPVVTAPGTATLTVTTSRATQIGSHELTITGTSGALVLSRNIALRVGAFGSLFEVDVTPGQQVTQQSSGASFNLGLDGVGEFTGAVALSVASQPPFPGAVYIASGVVAAPGTTMLHVMTDCSTRPGDYLFTVSAATDAATATAATTLTLEPFGTTTVIVASADTPAPIPDSAPAGITSAIDIADDLSIRQLSVTLDVSHTAIGDLVVELVAPGGKRVTLHDRAGGDGDDLRRTYTIGDFAGLSSAGPWRLVVSDHRRTEIGTLNRWELNLRGTPAAFPPAASFGVLANGLIAEFYDYSFGTSCSGDIPIVAWSWDFGDGATATQRDVVHTYAAPGDYVVTLTVTDAEGLTGTFQQPVTITHAPPALSIAKITRDRAHHKFWIELRWRGAHGKLLDLYRNWAPAAVLWNDGVYTDAFRSEETALRWQVCERPTLCSNDVSIDFGPDLDASRATIRTASAGKQIVETMTVEDH